MRLQHLPINTVTSLKINDAVVDLDTVYTYRSRIACQSRFSSGRQNVEVTYTAGYSSIPSDVSTAISLLCAMWIARVVGTGSGATTTLINVGPITLREDYSISGKYSDKINDWFKFLLPIIKKYSTKIRGVVNNEKPSRQYDPRSDSWT